MPSLSSLKNKVTTAVNQRPNLARPGRGQSNGHGRTGSNVSGSGGGSSGITGNGTDHQHRRSQAGAENDNQSLTTLLTRDQRAELTVLISQTIEEMRTSLIKGFDEKPKPKPKPEPKSEAAEEAAEEEAKGEAKGKGEGIEVETAQLSLSEQTTRQIQTEGSSHQDEKGEEAVVLEDPQPDILLAEHTPESKALKEAALNFFDGWAESVILRVGEVVNSRDAPEPNTSRSNTQTTQTQTPRNQGSQQKPFPPPLPPRQQNTGPTEREAAVDATLARIYPSIPTSLLETLSPLERNTIINAVLLLLLSLESYRAHSRTLLVRLAVSLQVSVSTSLSQMEKATSLALLTTAASNMDASQSTQKAQAASSSARKWKIGVAGVAGAALIGITGGLAAPFLAAGVGTVMGGLGLGATAAAGYLGAMAGSSVLVGGLFGAYGARMTSRSMEKYAKEIDDFAFLPTTTTTTTTGSTAEASGGSEEEQEAEQLKRHRLRICVGITGWLTAEEQVTLPWTAMSGQRGSEPFALRWELAALLALGSALKDFVVTQAWSQLRREIIKRTLFAAVWSALLAPLMIRKAIKLVDSPFGNAKNLSVKAGEVLADTLIEKVQGERPVSLVGQSLGARVIYSCLLTLAKRNAFGIVDDVVLMGAPVPAASPDQWVAMRSVVSGRFVNAFSTQDYILAFLYRTSSAQMSIAGLQDIECAYGVENFDVTDLVNGHLKYMHTIGAILERVGWVDLDEEVLKREEMLRTQIEEEEKELEEKGEDPEKADV